MSNKKSIALIVIIALMAGLGFTANGLYVDTARQLAETKWAMKQQEEEKIGERIGAIQNCNATSSESFLECSFERLKGRPSKFYKINDNRYWIMLEHGFPGGDSYSLWLSDRALENFQPDRFIEGFTSGQCGSYHWSADSEGVTTVKMSSPCEAYENYDYSRFDNSGTPQGTVHWSTNSTGVFFSNAKSNLRIELKFDGVCSMGKISLIGVTVNEKTVKLKNRKIVDCGESYGDIFGGLPDVPPSIGSPDWKGNIITIDLPGGGQAVVDINKGLNGVVLVEM